MSPCPQHAHDRHGLQRTDDAWLEERWADPATRVLVHRGRQGAAGRRARIAWVSPQEAPAGLRLLLGERDGVEHFAVVVDPAEAPGERDEWVVLRAVVQSLADHAIADAPLVLHAIGAGRVALVDTGTVPRCGGRLEARQAGHVLHCGDCGRDQFPRSDPAVIMMVTDGEPGSPRSAACSAAARRGRRGATPRWPGSSSPGETMEDAVRREVAEETGVRSARCSYFGSQPWPLPASLMVGFFARATHTDDRRRRLGDRGRALVHPRADARRGRGRHPACCPAACDLPLAGRELVRRPRCPARW